MVLGDAQRGQRGAQLVLAHPGHPVGRPAAGVVGAVLAERRGHADHPLACVAGGGHQACGQERLVVGVGPDAEHRAEAGGVGDRAGRADSKTGHRRLLGAVGGDVRHLRRSGPWAVVIYGVPMCYGDR